MRLWRDAARRAAPAGAKRHPAEVVLRLLLLKHIRNWSYEVLEREVRANLVYRDFTRVGAGKAPDAKTMGRWGLALGPEGVEEDSRTSGGDRPRANGCEGDARCAWTQRWWRRISIIRRTAICLGDGVRVLIRAMKRIGEIVGSREPSCRDRSRSVKLRILEIGRVARTKGGPNRERLQQGYEKLLVCSRPGGRTGQAIFQ